MSIQIDWLQLDRIGELQGFVDGHWRAEHVLARDDALLRWQHRSAVADRLSVLVAEERGELVGMLGFISFPACVRGRRLRGGWMTNWLVLPDRRGTGLGRRLVEHALEHEFDFVGALGGNETTQGVLSRLDFWTQPTMPRWVRVRSVDALADLLADRVTAYPEDAWHAWRSLESTPPPASDVVPRGWDAKSGERWDEIFEQRFARSVIGAWKGSEYVQRRFLDHPVFEYEILVTGNGMAVYRIETVRETEHSVLRIVDLLADGDAAHVLAAALAQDADDRGVVFADFFCASRRFGRALESAGFALEASLPEALPARFQPLDFSGRALASSFWVGGRAGAPGLDGEDLYVTRADSDLDRPN